MRAVSALLLFGAMQTFAFAPSNAQEQRSLYWQAPESWRAEVIPFPLSFAPDIELEGVEELRFAPGMFDPASETYFTYTFVWWLKGRPTLDPPQLEKHLMKYFSGLYVAVSKQEKKDVSGFRVAIERDTTSRSKNLAKERLRGRVVWIDPFATEEELTLQLRAWRWYCSREERTAVFFALSPQDFENPIWKTMEKMKAGECE